jgi:hypothetical protein
MFNTCSVARTKVQGNPELSPKQGLREGGAKGATCPGPPVKGGPKICKRGPRNVIKCVIKKNVERFLYESWYERNLLDLNFVGIGPKKCVLDVILQVFATTTPRSSTFLGKIRGPELKICPGAQNFSVRPCTETYGSPVIRLNSHVAFYLLNVIKLKSRELRVVLCERKTSC